MRRTLVDKRQERDEIQKYFDEIKNKPIHKKVIPIYEAEIQVKDAEIKELQQQEHDILKK
jgi:hypothetical protein